MKLTLYHCTVTELNCNISFGSTSLYTLSMEIRETDPFYENMFFFENFCQKVKSSFILNVDLDKSGIVYPFKPFCLFRAILVQI